MTSLPFDISGLPILSFSTKSRNLLILVGAAYRTARRRLGSIAPTFRNNERCLHFGRHDSRPATAKFSIDAARVAEEFTLFDLRANRWAWPRYRFIRSVARVVSRKISR